VATTKDQARAAILDRLTGFTQFHPANASLFTDWSVEPGDVLRVENEGTIYDVPVYQMDMSWKGTPTVDVQSTGSKKRPDPSKLNRGGGYGGNRKKEEEEIEMIRHRADIDKSDEKLSLWATEEEWDIIRQDYVEKQRTQFDLTSSGITSLAYETGLLPGVKEYFNPAKMYKPGQYVLYGSPAKTYKFTALHMPGAAWDDSIVELVHTQESLISQTQEELSSTITKTGIADLPTGKTLYSYSTEIKQTADNINAEVSAARGTSASLSSALDLKANQASLSTVLDSDGKVTAASIATAINAQGSQAYIDADHVYISGTVTLKNKLSINESGGLSVSESGLAIAGSTQPTITLANGRIAAKYHQVSQGGYITFVGSGSGEYYNLDTSNVPNLHASATIASDTLTVGKLSGGSAFTIQKSGNNLLISDGTSTITFSKATTPTGAWNGSGTYQVSVDGTVKLTTTPSLRLTGSGTTNFSAEMLSDGSSPTVQKSVTGYLHQSGGTVGVYTTYSGGSYSGIIASLPVDISSALEPSKTVSADNAVVTVSPASGYSGMSEVKIKALSLGTRVSRVPTGGHVLSGVVEENGYYPVADNAYIYAYFSDASITISCSSNVRSIGTDYGTRKYAGYISKSGLVANSYLGFTIQAGGSTQTFYITVNA